MSPTCFSLWSALVRFWPLAVFAAQLDTDFPRKSVSGGMSESLPGPRPIWRESWCQEANSEQMCCEKRKPVSWKGRYWNSYWVLSCFIKLILCILRNTSTMRQSTLCTVGQDENRDHHYKVQSFPLLHCCLHCLKNIPQWPWYLHYSL